jgi:hypothetical protein
MQPLLKSLRRLADRLRTSRGQGTVEYVGIVLAVGALLLALTGALPGQAARSVGKKVEAAVVNAIDKTMGDSGTSGGDGTSGN